MPLEFDGVNSKVSADKIQGQTGTTVTIESGHSLSGSGASLTNLPAANLTGTVADARISTLTASKLSGTIDGARLPDPLPAISGASLTNLPGEKRNFIIDGDFTQWPTGAAANSSSKYQSALMYGRPDIGTVLFSRSTDVPTTAQSGHTSTYSFKVDCTATGSLASGTKLKLFYWMTGSDYAHLHRQPFVFSFWVKSYQTGIHTCGFQNGSGTRTYIAEYTVNASATWEQKTIVVPAESSDTGWLFTEADKGIAISFGLAVGSAQQTAAGSWTTGNYNGSPNNQNFTSSTNNYINIAQLGLYLGSTAPTFSSPPIATVRDQVDWYVQRYDYNTIGHEYICPAYTLNNSGYSRGMFNFRKEVRRTPTMSDSGAGTFQAHDDSSGNVTTGNFSYEQVGRHGTIFSVTHAAQTVSAGGHIRRDSSDTCWILVDARH